MVGLLIAPLIALSIGAIVGSFIGVVATRVPLGEGIVGGRSRCDHCRATLSAGELVPIVSYVALRGRCRHCRAAIDPLTLVAEIAGALVALIALAVTQTPLAAFVIALFGWAVLALALIDWRHLWLPDWLTLPLIAAGLGAVWIFPAINLQSRLLGAGFGYAALQALRLGYRRLRGREGLGGGDPKLVAAIAAWLGAPAIPAVLLAASMLGLGLVAVDCLRGRRIAADREMPFGTLLGVAAIAALPIFVTR